MKIRHKQSGVELEGEFIECGEGGPCIPSVSYFACERYGSRYDMREWEAVPEWVDVTNSIDERALNTALCEYEKSTDYRVRKVGVEWFSGVPLGLAKSGWAFIVERKA